MGEHMKLPGKKGIMQPERLTSLCAITLLIKTYRWQLIVASGLILWCALQLNSMIHTSATEDEPDHVAFGLGILQGNPNTASTKMPVTVLNALPLYLKGQNTASLNLNNNDPANWLAIRIPTLIMGATILLFVFFWSKSLFGLRGAMVSFLAAILCPNLAAHAALATTDIPCALTITIALWSLLTFYREKSYATLILAALTVGISQLTKNTALILIPFGLCIILFAELHGNCLKLKRNKIGCVSNIVLRFGIFCIIIISCINAGYGFQRTLYPVSNFVPMYREYMQPNEATMQTAVAIIQPIDSYPVPLPYGFVETILFGIKANNTFAGHGPIYLLGKLDSKGFWYYFPVIFLLKVPIPLILLSILAVKNVIQTRHKEGLFLIACSGILFASFTMGCTAQIGFRYLLPMMPLLYVAMGIIPQSLEKSGRIGIGMLIVAFGWLAISTMSYYPHLISYINELAWDRNKLYKYCADSNLDWGQSDWYLERYLDEHPSAQVEPSRPTHGEVIVSANQFLGITAPLKQYEWLRNNYKPIGSVAYSWLVFSVP